MKRYYENTASRLSDAEKQNLIELVEQQSSLWNEEDVQYKSFHARARAWREVTKEMEIKFHRAFDVDVLQKSFKNLRDVYVRKRREYQDAVKRNSGAEAGVFERIRAWPFYNSFVFLDPVNDHGERYCNVDVNYNDNDPLLDVENISDLTAAEAVDMQSESSSVQTQSQVPSVQTAPPPSITKKSSKRQQKNSAIEQFASVMKDNFENPDTFESMGHLLSSNLRELKKRNPDLAEEFIIKFNEFLLQLSKAIFQSKRNPALVPLTNDDR